MYCANLNDLKSTLVEMQNHSKVQSVLLFLADKDQPKKEELETLLKLFPKPLIGGIFPEIIADGKRHEQGFLVVPLCYELKTVLVDLSEDINEINETIANHAEALTIVNPGIFCFTDALAPHKSTLIDSLYDCWGPDANYVGGGAGSLSFQPFPCIIHQDTIAKNAAVIGVMDTDIRVGVAHGWTPISEPIKVTETDGNSIISLNWEPAFDVYKKQIKAHSDADISAENFFDIAKSYPLGLVRLDSEMTIRDPYATENGKLHIVDNVPEGEYIRIMNGNMDSLLEGAKTAVSAPGKHVNSEAYEQFCVDCISRVLYMQDEFGQELALLNKQKPMNGVLSIGEIANPGDTVLELFNKTIVVAKWNRVD